MNLRERTPGCGMFRRLPALLAAFLLVPVPLLAAPGDILFSDGFEDGLLAPWTTTNGARAGVSSRPGFASTGALGAFTRWDPVTVTSPSFSAAVPEARLEVWVRRGSDAFSEYPDTNENLNLQYQRSNGTWATLRTYLGGGTPGEIFNDSFVLPADALHASLALRFSQSGGSGSNFDYWHFDDIVVTEVGPGPPLAIGGCEEFEAGLAGNWTVNPTSGAAGTSSATAQSPTNSLFLNGGVVEVTSTTVDTSEPAFGDLTIWVRRGDDDFSEDPDNGENLVVEYLDDLGTWVALETFTGNGGPGQIFTRAYTLPAGGRHPKFRVRFRQTGGSGDGFDYWHVDDVCFDLSTDPVLQVTKITLPITDPINGSSNPRAIPGAVMQYTIGVTNQGLGSVDGDTLAITDTVPANTALYVDTGGGDPIQFVDGATASGLSYDYATDVTFSSQAGGGAPYDYVPAPDAQGYDPLVTGFRINPGGAMNSAGGGTPPSFNLVLRVRID